VDLSPEGHAQGRTDVFRAATVEAAKLDPSVGPIQYGTIVGNGTGNQWAVVFTEQNYKITVQYDNANIRNLVPDREP
jgi:hypothetical protein